MKEAIGIIFGLICIIGVPIFLYTHFSDDEIKGRTEPVMELAIENPVFKDPVIQKNITELELKKLRGFLFQMNSQTRIYYPYYAGICPKGAEAVKKQFPQAKEVIPGRIPRTVSVLKLSGMETPGTICSGLKTREWNIEFCGDIVIISFLPESTNVFLDKLQMQHFLGRYFE